jgi:type II secretory ATPase GspE/PulE/Tfp pilus assembly ATPase PilB-like protein
MIEPVIVTEDDSAVSHHDVRAVDGEARGGGIVVRQAGRPRRRRGADPKSSAAAMADPLQSDRARAAVATDIDDKCRRNQQDLMSASEDAPIIRLPTRFSASRSQEASDIHIEPMEGDVTIRFRVDGVLQVVQRLPKRVQLGLISRLKILSHLDISEKRLPQDGRISVLMEGKSIDFRVSTVPGTWGEKVVMRILDKSTRPWASTSDLAPPTLRLWRGSSSRTASFRHGPTGLARRRRLRRWRRSTSRASTSRRPRIRSSTTSPA